VAVTKNGYRAYTEEVDLARDEQKRIVVEFRPTSQRVVAYGFFVGAAAAVVTGGVLTAIALKNQGDASSLLDRQPSGTLLPPDLNDYEAARSRRDDFNKASFIAYGVAGGALVTGAILYLFDQPVVGATATRTEDRKKPAPPTPPSGPREPIELGFAPLLAPSAAGGALTGRF
jgi:hypothetical protein